MTRLALVGIAVCFLLLGAACGGATDEWPVRAVVASAASCEGDECQGPAPAPEDPAPGTAVVEGPSNPPVRFPAPSHHKKKHRHHRGKRTGR